jgi:hypothetical protein
MRPVWRALAAWLRFWDDRLPRAYRLETPTCSAEPAMTEPAMVSPSFPERMRGPVEPSRACPSCLVPACQGAHRLLGQPTVEAAEVARQVREEGVEVSGFLEVAEAAEAVRGVREVREVVAVEQAVLERQPHHPHQAAEAVASPGQARHSVRAVEGFVPGAAPEDSFCCTWPATCSEQPAAAGSHTAVPPLRDSVLPRAREHCVALLQRPRSSWQPPPWPARTCCRAASAVV